jgi:hypothetical protein
LLLGAWCVLVGLLIGRMVHAARHGCRDVGLWAGGFGFLAQSLVILFLVAKHPGVRYLLPLAATAPLLLAAALSGLSPAQAAHRGLVGLSAVAVLWFGVSLVMAVAAHVTLAANMQRDDAATEAWLQDLAAHRGVDRSALRILWAYGTTSPCYALWLGDTFSDGLFRSDIGRLCARDGNLDIWQPAIVSGTGVAGMDAAAEWDVAIVPLSLAERYPAARPPGGASTPGIGSPSYGELVFITPATDSP